MGDPCPARGVPGFAPPFRVELSEGGAGSSHQNSLAVGMGGTWRWLRLLGCPWRKRSMYLQGKEMVLMVTCPARSQA